VVKSKQAKRITMQISSREALVKFRTPSIVLFKVNHQSPFHFPQLPKMGAVFVVQKAP